MIGTQAASLSDPAARDVSLQRMIPSLFELWGIVFVGRAWKPKEFLSGCCGCGRLDGLSDVLFWSSNHDCRTNACGYNSWVIVDSAASSTDPVGCPTESSGYGSLAIGSIASSFYNVLGEMNHAFQYHFQRDYVGIHFQPGQLVARNLPDDVGEPIGSVVPDREVPSFELADHLLRSLVHVQLQLREELLHEGHHALFVHAHFRFQFAFVLNRILLTSFTLRMVCSS